MTPHERTGWRDDWPSAWHRQLGNGWPLCDVDALLYDQRRPVALVDWKLHHARWSPTQASLAAQRALADGYRDERHPDGLPFYVVTYWPADLRFRPHAMNRPALDLLTASGPIDGNHAGRPFRTLSEAAFVELAGRIRGLPLPDVVRAIARLKASPMPTPRSSTVPMRQLTYSMAARRQRQQEPSGWKRPDPWAEPQR